MTIPRRTIDHYTMLSKALAEVVDIIDSVGKVTEVSPAGITLWIPVVGEFDHGCTLLPCVLYIIRGSKKYERKSPGLVIIAADLDESQRVTVKVQRFVDILNSYHCVKVFYVGVLEYLFGDKGRC